MSKKSRYYIQSAIMLTTLIAALYWGKANATTFQQVEKHNTVDCYTEVALMGRDIGGFPYLGNKYNNRFSLLVNDKDVITFKYGKTYLAYSKHGSPVFSMEAEKGKRTITAILCRWEATSAND